MTTIRNMAQYLAVCYGAELLGKATQKYGNQKVKLDTVTFDSVAEAAHYALVLKPLKETGKITNLRPHPSFLLIPGFTEPGGAKVRPAYYEADFQYEQGGITVVEDVKGLKTDLFEFKLKLLKSRYPQLREPGHFRLIDSKTYSLRNAAKLRLIRVV